MLPSGHEPSVAATILRSVRHLPEEGRDVLRLAALLAVAPIPPALVASTFGHVDNLADRDAKRRAIHGLDQVERASLAERGDGDARLVHALVSRTMRFRDDRPERREALRAAVVAALSVPAAGDRFSELWGGPAEVQHARALIGLGDLWDLDTLVLAGWVARHDHQRGLYAMARRVEERVLEARRRVLGEDHPDTLTSMNNLAETLRAQGDLAGARGWQERVLEARRRVLGEDHPDTLTSVNNLGATLELAEERVVPRPAQPNSCRPFGRTTTKPPRPLQAQERADHTAAIVKTRQNSVSGWCSRSAPISNSSNVDIPNAATAYAHRRCKWTNSLPS